MRNLPIHSYTKAAAEKFTAADVLAPSNFLADFIGSGSSFNRSGRGRAVAKALDQDAPFNIQHPLIASALSVLGGAAGGAGIGHYAGGGGSGKTLIGAGLGGLAGSLANSLYRSNQLGRLSGDLQDALDSGKALNLAEKPVSGIANYIPRIAPGRAGETDAYLQMKHKNPKSDMGYTVAEEIASKLPYGGLPSMALQGVQGHRARRALIDDAENDEKLGLPGLKNGLDKVGSSYVNLALMDVAQRALRSIGMG